MGINREWNAHPFTTPYDARTVSKDDTAPPDSYWAKPDIPREGFTAYVQAHHQPRQRRSKFGVPDANITVGPLMEPAGSRMKREANQKRMRDGFAWAGGQ